MKRYVYLSYGVAAYLAFGAVFVYLVGFLANAVVPRSVDVGPAAAPGIALLIDTALVLLFGVQHSVMARPFFKRAWTRLVPEPIERSTYLVLSAVCLAALYWLWRPIGGVVWSAESGTARALLWSLFGAGWLLVFAATCMISHTDLFGLRQVWLAFRGRPYEPVAFGVRGLYRHVRHPLYVGWMTAFWATPSMTVGHLLFAGSMTLYMLLAIRFEERDLAVAHGAAYERYRQSTPMLVPCPRAPRPVADEVAG